MFKNVLVGIGRHDSAGDAIKLAEKLLEPGGRLTLAHVFSGSALIGGDYASVQRERAEALLEEAGQAAGVDAAMRWRESSSIGRGLHELCELADADLLVVGSSQRSLIGRVLLGDDTHAALNAAPCAIAVAPAGYADDDEALHAIGVAYDASPESEQALMVARSIVARARAELSSLQVVSLPASTVVHGADLSHGSVDRLLAEARRGLATLERVDARAVYGDPAEELALYSGGLDLLVVGSRGYGPLGRLLHGSTSQKLARTARCPLLVIPRPLTLPLDDRAGSGEQERVVAAGR